MGKHDKTKAKVYSGTSNANIEFQDLCTMLEHEGFMLRIVGSHHIYSHSDIPDIINLQPTNGGKAKPYQVKQVAAILQGLRK